jgi:hypothetical protein
MENTTENESVRLSIEDRLHAIKQSLLESPAKSDQVAMACFWIRHMLESGYNYGGYTWIPVKAGPKVKTWKLRVHVCQFDAKENPDIQSRDF